jgi:sugar phosphate permease
VSEQVHDIGRRRAWAIWLVGLAVYVLAVFHRSSLGVAGIMASERFGASATELALFTVLQLVVYAAMQVPVGVLLDRFGSRAMLLAGLVLMTGAQLAFSFAETLPAAIVARAVLGAGDAMIFLPVLRLVSAWFLVRQAPMVTQLTGQVGQSGAILAAGPLAWGLHALGWTRAFAIASSVGVLLMVAVVLVVKNSPYREDGTVKVKLAALARTLRLVWGNPGTRLGMWSHFSGQFSVTVFGMLWGYPFLVRAQGLSPREASVLLMVMTAWIVLAGVVLGHLTSRHPYHRSHLVLGVVAMIASMWTVVLLWPGPAPMPVLVLLVLVIACGGPASLVGFDLARTFTPAEAAGRANGLVNIGGFLASLLTMALVGVVLDLRAPGGMSTYDRLDFRAAMSVQYLFWGLGALQVWRYRHKALAHLRREHPGAVEMLQRGEPFVHPGFSDREGL